MYVRVIPVCYLGAPSESSGTDSGLSPAKLCPCGIAKLRIIGKQPQLLDALAQRFQDNESCSRAMLLTYCNHLRDEFLSIVLWNCFKVYELANCA